MMRRNEDPRAYLDTEARLIAENETHVVMAIRVEKAVIGRNLRFFAALADLSFTDSKQRLPEPPGGKI